MSDIKAGDLVVIVKPSPCCNSSGGIGKIFTVTEVRVKIAFCKYCYKHQETLFAEIGPGRNVQINRVKKINPSRDEDFVETNEELEDVSHC